MNSPGCLYFILVSAAVAIGCKKPYQPCIQAANYGYLVTEAVINICAQTTIQLSRWTSLASTIAVRSFKGAVVIIENDPGSTPNDPIRTSPFFVLTHYPRQPDGYRSARVECVDCMIRGRQVKRLFWK